MDKPSLTARQSKRQLDETIRKKQIELENTEARIYTLVAEIERLKKIAEKKCST